MNVITSAKYPTLCAMPTDLLQVADMRRAMEDLRQQGRQRVASLLSEVMLFADPNRPIASTPNFRYPIFVPQLCLFVTNLRGVSKSPYLCRLPLTSFHTNLSCTVCTPMSTSNSALTSTSISISLPGRSVARACFRHGGSSLGPRVCQRTALFSSHCSC